MCLADVLIRTDSCVPLNSNILISKSTVTKCVCDGVSNSNNLVSEIEINPTKRLLALRCIYLNNNRIRLFQVIKDKDKGQGTGG